MGEQRPLDAGATPTEVADAQVTDSAAPPAVDASTDPAPLDATVEPAPVDAAAEPAPDAGIIVIDGDAGTGWILAQQCPVSTESDPCYVCEDNFCCEAYARYRANPEASAYWQCADQCTQSGGSSCEEKCHAEHPMGTADVAARRACLAQFCPAECGTGQVTECTTCGQQQCASQLVAAAASESGFLAQGCNSSCNPSDTACAQKCAEQYSQGAGLLLLAGECIKTKCPQCAPAP